MQYTKGTARDETLWDAMVGHISGQTQMDVTLSLQPFSRAESGGWECLAWRRSR